MYQAPDFVKVSAKAKDIFASYTSGCVPAVWHGIGSFYLFVPAGSDIDACDQSPDGGSWQDGYRFDSGEWVENCFLHNTQ